MFTGTPSDLSIPLLTFLQLSSRGRQEPTSTRDPFSSMNLSTSIPASSKKMARALPASIALCFVLASPSLAVTETWTGGGTDNLTGTGANWLDGTAPVNDLVNTDLVFAGTTRLAPLFPGFFSARS